MAYIKLPNNASDLNDALCGMYNRTGTLCGSCVNGTYLHAYSYDMSCTECVGDWSNWIKYIVIAYVPMTLLYMIVLLFKVNIPSSHLQGYILFSQIISLSIILRDILIYMRDYSDNTLDKATQIFGTLYEIWNLDFFSLTEYTFVSKPVH